MLLVPNKHLETPNYKLERLRHDDPRLENLQASYTMIEEPTDEVGITRRGDVEKKNKQEPVIKGILPEQPAPMPAPHRPRWRLRPWPRPPQSPRQPPRTGKGLFSRLIGWLSGGSEPAAIEGRPRPQRPPPTSPSVKAAMVDVTEAAMAPP